MLESAVEIGSTAVVHGAGDGKALVYVLKSRSFWFICAASAPILSKFVRQWWQMKLIISWKEQCWDTSHSVYNNISQRAHWIGAANRRGSMFDFISKDIKLYMHYRQGAVTVMRWEATLTTEAMCIAHERIIYVYIRLTYLDARLYIWHVWLLSDRF